MFCLFSFGTAKLRARIHQQRRQALVSQDNGDRWTQAQPAPAPPAVTTTAALVLPLPTRESWLETVRRPLPQGVRLAAPQPQRGPPRLS